MKKIAFSGLVALGTTLCMGFTAPAFANNAASVDIAAPLRSAEAARIGAAPAGDEEFSKLFASWEALDGGIATATQSPVARSNSVSIPTLVPISSGRAMSSGFGLRNHPIYGGLRAHKGVDLPAATGTPIRATADGLVGKAERFGGYGLYVQLDAPFVAVAQIVIYAGAIMVLFLFVVMLLNAPQEDAAVWDRTHHLRRGLFSRFGTLLGGLLVVELAWAVLRVRALSAPVAERGDAATVSSVRELGRVLFTDYSFSFEATSILILVAMVGAVVLARREADQ